MKKILSLFLLTGIVILSVGCSNSKDIIVSIGTYLEEDETSFLKIVIEDEQNFTFTHMALSSWPSKGNYIIENEQLTLIIDNENKYSFDIKNDSLIFNASSSSVLQEAYPEFENLKDGTVFVLLEQ